MPLPSGLGLRSLYRVPNKTEHIAVIRLSAMGDVAMTVPVLRAFTQQYPNVKVTVVSRPFFKPLFATLPVDFFAFEAQGRHKGLFGLLRLFGDLRKLGIDAFADLHHVLRAQIIGKLFKLSGVRTASVDKGRAAKKALTRLQPKTIHPLEPMTARHAKVFAQLGFPLDLSQPNFPAPARLDAAVASIAGDHLGPWIGIAPFAQYQGKVYPKDLMQQVIDALSANASAKLFLFGGKGEKAELDAFASGKSNTIVLTGKLNFEQELQLISHLDVMLSMDSGNGHIAAMLGVKTVTLWGATHPYAGFAPFAQPDDFALVANREQFPLLPTSVYGNKKVAGYENAMRTIDPKTVVEKINEITG